MLAALIEVRSSGRGQVVDAAVVDGTAHLMATFHGLLAAAIIREERGVNLMDSGAPFYDCYACADGRYVSVAPIEGRFFTELLWRLGIDAGEVPPQSDCSRWPELRRRLADTFATRSRDDWCALLEGSDACFAPVLTMEEAARHPHMQARQTYIEIDGVVQPAPAPRFSRSVPETPAPPLPVEAQDAADTLDDWLDRARVEALRSEGILP